MPSALYLARGTPLLFADSAQAEDAILTLSALATVTGRVSARYDRGAGSLPGLFEWRLHCSLTGTNVVGAAIEVYCFTSDGTNVDGEVGTADAAFATDKRNNARPCGILAVDQVTTNVVMTASGIVLIPTRYFSMGIWNATTLPFTTSTSGHGLVMTPMYWETQ
jgi:hypothetical protein